MGLGLSLSGIELPVPFDDIDELHPVPLTADATLTSTACMKWRCLRRSRTPSNKTDIQRWTAMERCLLPDGTAHEVLRLKSTVVSDDSVYVNLAGQGFAFERETVTYAWLGDGGMPWMEVSTTLGMPTVVRYQGSAPEPEDISALDGNQEETRSVHCSPNPANAASVSS